MSGKKYYFIKYLMKGCERERIVTPNEDALDVLETLTYKGAVVWNIESKVIGSDEFSDRAVVIELDYKGYYKRYALTIEEFEKEFDSRLIEDMPYPGETAYSYTLRPMVHIWYKIEEIGGAFWKEFFTDMEWGLPESDIESGNLAYIDVSEMKSLLPYLPEGEEEWEE